MALKSEIRNARDLSTADKDRLFNLMKTHYDGVTSEFFEKDLSGKNYVILVRDLSGIIRGFSTLVIRRFSDQEKSWTGIFSGDTVVESQYWGQSALQLAFTKFVFGQKLRRINEPLYWFLISKGYKTYLLLANNFLCHYPRYEKATPHHFQKKMDIFYSEIFGTQYNPKSGHVNFGAEAARLKPGIANITDQERSHPRIAYFEKMNPNWTQGVELACLGEVTLCNALFYIWKKTLRPVCRSILEFIQPSKPVLAREKSSFLRTSR